MTLLRGQHKGRTEKCTNAGGPAKGEDHTEGEGGEEARSHDLTGLDAAFEELELENAKKVQTKENHEKARYNIHSGFIGFKEAAQSTGESTHGDKNNSKAQNEAGGSQKGLFGTALATACKIGNIDREHGQKTRGNKGNNSF